MNDNTAAMAFERDPRMLVVRYEDLFDAPHAGYPQFLIRVSRDRKGGVSSKGGGRRKAAAAAAAARRTHEAYPLREEETRRTEKAVR